MVRHTHNKKEVAWVTKTSGERESFSFDKLRRSLVRSGADDATANQVIEHITPELKDGMKTSAIYKHAFSILKKKYYPVAVRYSLRQAVMQLGPSGFPFEKFVAELLRRKGYRAQTGVVLSGFCVSHEVDILMEKDARHIFVECKFHNQQAVKSDIKTALYVHARFLDLKKRHDTNKEITPTIHEGWLITNTKLTGDAIAYAQCAGLTVVGWDYPEHGNLQDLILETGIHPLTFLSSLSTREKNALLEQGIVMCRTIAENEAPLRAMGFSKERIDKITNEVLKVCQMQ